jgi:carboxyl-terminal processing protease
MGKQRRKISTLVIVLVTIAGTLLASNFLTLKFGDKVLISVENYDYYKDMEQTFSKAAELESFAKANYYKPVENEVIEDGMLHGIFDSFPDPYTTYMNKEENDYFKELSTGVFAGIGIEVTINEEGYIEVIAPIEDTPAYRAGIQSGDYIVKVDGTVVGESNYSEAIKMMRGEPGTDVNIMVKRKDVDGFIDLRITRAFIKSKTVKYKVLEDNIGYIRISSFDDGAKGKPGTGSEFKDALKELRSENIEGLILDLRGNPGGSLDQCNIVADEILGKTVITYTKDRHGNIDTYKSDERKKLEIPFVLLVNDGSASASEIITGAVKDTKAAPIVGTKTFGKGIVQSYYQLNDGSAFKITTSEYFTPNDINIHGKGIEPDYVVENEKDEVGVVISDTQLEKALELVRE